MKRYDILLSFVDDGKGHFDEIAVSDTSGLDPALLARFLLALGKRMSNGNMKVSHNERQ